MTTVGIVGGLGPESTIDYYRRILEAWEREDPSTAPSIVIDSLDVGRALRLVENDRPALTEYLLGSLRRLAGAGVDFVAISANTPHIVFDDLAARSPVPLLSIVEVCAEEARRRGLKRLGLLGTRFTMEAPFYPAVCARYGIVVMPPHEADRAWVHERYVGELLKGEFRDDTRQRIVSLVGRLRDQERIDGVILGGTELPLLLATPVIAGVPALDTTALHVSAIVRRLRDTGPSTLLQPPSVHVEEAPEDRRRVHDDLCGHLGENGFRCNGSDQRRIERDVFIALVLAHQKLDVGDAAARKELGLPWGDVDLHDSPVLLLGMGANRGLHRPVRLLRQVVRLDLRERKLTG